MPHDYFRSSFDRLRENLHQKACRKCSTIIFPHNCFVALSWSCPNSLKFPFAFSVDTTAWSARAIFSDWTNLSLSLLGRDSQRRYKTTLDLRCNMYADVGNPGPENNRTGYYFKFPCEYFLVWESMYACPKCQGHEVEKVVGECINGTRNVTFVRSVPCWGTGRRNEIEVPIEACPLVSAVNDTIVLYQTEKSSGNAIKIVIGVCVTVILVLLGIVLFFVYRHRTMKYRYFNSLARDKPMSRLAEEDELDEQFNESSPCS